MGFKFVRPQIGFVKSIDVPYLVQQDCDQLMILIIEQIELASIALRLANIAGCPASTLSPAATCSTVAMKVR